jgi:predicted helicase
MGFFLEELGHRLNDDERVPFYLTNTLDNEELEESRLPGFSALAEESRLAGKVKKQTPILVILGNPPYSGISTNKGHWITGLIEDYKYVDGKPLGEKKHWLQDDYVKFLRFAQWKIEQAGRGVVGMITNHGYLDNPTFRGMRQSLMRTFDEIYILDLHGNSLKKETCPDGSPDKNVFDIRQGVAIAFFVKRGGERKADAVVRHAERWGPREVKYNWLNAQDLKHTDWAELKPECPFHFFVPRNEEHTGQYRTFTRITEVFPVNVTGIVTARDRFVLDFDRDALLRRIGQFRDRSLSDEFIRQAYGLKDTRGWQLSQRRRDLAEMENWREHCAACLYRPFDTRVLYYHPYMVDWGRPEVMRHMLAGENLGIAVGRAGQVIGPEEWNIVFCTDHITEFNLYRRGGNNLFPLYLYPNADRDDLFAHHEPTERQSNLNPKVVAALEEAYGRQPTPEEIFHYVYAVLYAPTYRAKYAEFLRMDFPRVPFTSDVRLFGQLVALGERLTALHLLTSPELDPPACRFEGEGDSRIGKGKSAGLRYEAKEQRAYINAAQYFAPVAEAVWSYQVGGYQVCEKWLKDRQERQLDVDDIRTYCRIVTSLKLTLDIQQEIDALYPRAENRTVVLPRSVDAPSHPAS